MDPRLVKIHVASIGERGADWRGYPPISKDYPTITPDARQAFELIKIEKLRDLVKQFQASPFGRSVDLDQHPAVTALRGAKVDIQFTKATNTAVNRVLYALKILETMDKIDAQSQLMVANVLDPLFKIGDGNDGARRVVLETLKTRIGSLLISDVGLVSKKTRYTGLGVASTLKKGIGSLIDSLVGQGAAAVGGSTPARIGSTAPDRTEFPLAFFAELVDLGTAESTLITHTMIHEGFHRTVPQMGGIGADLAYRDDANKLAKLTTQQSLNNPDSVTLFVMRVTELTFVPEEEKTIYPGDSLWDIAADRYGKGTLWEVIWKRNQDQIADPNVIFPGQVIKIPKLDDAEKE